MSFEFYHWLITGALAGGFVGALVVLWRHKCECECVHGREWSRRYGSGPHGDGVD